LERRFPELKFPMDTHGTVIPDGYVRVVHRFENPKELHNYTETLPVLIDGEWKQNWHEEPYSQERIEQATPRYIEAAVLKRLELLRSSDWTQLPDAPLSDGKKELYRKYRQDLRDITTQESFPFNLNWPIEPI